MINSIYTVCLFALLAMHGYARSVKRKGAQNQQRDLVTWEGKWFPFAPNDHPTITPPHKQTSSSNECDNAMNIRIDFDPADKRHSYNYLCLSNRSLFTPHLETEALLIERLIPQAYEAPIKCLNESIDYIEKIPTFGSYRLLAPTYGAYKYLPPQRWLHSLADGAIVMLYHPCGDLEQRKLLQNTVESCLYRHIVSPTQGLSPERPFALLAWGKLLQMSVVDGRTVVDFIKQNAKHGSRRQGKPILTTVKYAVTRKKIDIVV